MTVFNVRPRTAVLWTSLNPTLDVGQPGLETDTGRWKFGDGVTSWTGLPYLPAGQAGPWISVLGGVGFHGSWVNTAGGYTPCSYRLSADTKHCELAGWASGGGAFSVIFQLPLALCPLTFKYLNVNYISVPTNGNVTASVAGFGLLDGLSFPLDI